MDLQFTAVFRQVPEGYIGFVEELPGANTQGAAGGLFAIWRRTVAGYFGKAATIRSSSAYLEELR
jgi:hypothetical protein